MFAVSPDGNMGGPERASAVDDVEAFAVEALDDIEALADVDALTDVGALADVEALDPGVAVWPVLAPDGEVLPGGVRLDGFGAPVDAAVPVPERWSAPPIGPEFGVTDIPRGAPDWTTGVPGDVAPAELVPFAFLSRGKVPDAPDGPSTGAPCGFTVAERAFTGSFVFVELC